MRLPPSVRDWWYFAGQGHIGPWRFCPACQLGRLWYWVRHRGDEWDE